MADNRILDQSDKFRTETFTDGYVQCESKIPISFWFIVLPLNRRRYKSTMRLNITRIRPDDFGEYQCVSKNEINTTTKMFYVYGKPYAER